MKRPTLPHAAALVAAFSAAAVGAGIGRALVTAYVPVLLERLRDAPALIGAAMLVNAAAALIVPLAVGVWSDRRRAGTQGRRRPILLGGAALAAGGLVAIAGGHATSYAALAAAAFVAYAGLSAIASARRIVVVERSASAGRAASTAGDELALLAGLVVGLVAGDVLLDDAAWAPFVAGAGAIAVLVAASALRGRRRSSTSSEAPSAPTPAALSSSGRVREVARLVARPGVGLLLAAQALVVAAYAGLAPFFLLYVEPEFDVTAGDAVLWACAFAAIAAVAMLYAAGVAPARRRAVLLVGALTMGAGMLAVSVAEAQIAVATALVPVAVGFGLTSTLGFAVFADLAPEGREGAHTGLFFAARAVGVAVGVGAAGLVLAGGGDYRTVFVLGGAASLAAAVPLLRAGGAASPAVVRAIGVRAAVFAGATAVLFAITRAIHETGLLRADEAGFELLHGQGPTSGLVDELLVEPNLRNYVLIVLLVGGIGARLWGRTPPLRTALLVAGAGCVAYAGVRFCWAVWERPRPEEVLGIVPVKGNSWAPYSSFPSGHMAVTTALVATTAALVPPLRWVLWPYALAIGLTRLTYGAHFPSDVVAGALLGLVASALVLRPLGAPLWRPPARRPGPSRARRRPAAARSPA